MEEKKGKICDAGVALFSIIWENCRQLPDEKDLSGPDIVPIFFFFFGFLRSRPESPMRRGSDNRGERTGDLIIDPIRGCGGGRSSLICP